MIGLDTSAIIDLFKGNENVKVFLEQNREGIAVTMMSYLELFFGLEKKNPKYEKEGVYYREFFKRVHVLPLTLESCEDASYLFWSLKKEGKEIEQFDCVIAAIFLNNGINKIITKNAKHFERIKKMQILKY